MHRNGATNNNNSSRFFWESPHKGGKERVNGTMVNKTGNVAHHEKGGNNGATTSHDCFCSPKASGGTISCVTCGKKFHLACVAKAQRYNCIEKCMRKKYLCGMCRIYKMDPFSGVVHQITKPVALDSRRPQHRNLRLSFTLPPDLRGYMVQIRSITLDGNIHTGPAWPYSVDAFVNSKRAFRVEPPKYLHNRREQNYDISNTIQAGKENDIELHMVYDKKQSESTDLAKVYLIGLFVVKNVAVGSLIADVKKRAFAPRDRYKRVLEKLSADPEDEIICESHGAGRTMTFIDPVSHCRIGTPCIGVNCVHLQTFDLDSYLHVNSLTRSLATRWHCPVCNALTLPEDIIIDSFMSRILSEQQGIGKVIIKDDGGWEVVLDDTPDVHCLDESDSEQQMAQQQEPQQQQQQPNQQQQQQQGQPPQPKLPVHALPRKAATVPVVKAIPVPSTTADDGPPGAPCAQRDGKIIEIIDSD